MSIYHFKAPEQGKRRLLEWRQHVLRAVLMLIILMLVSTTGLILLDASQTGFTEKFFQAIWNTVNLITTLGDFSDFSIVEKLFMMSVMLAAAILGGGAISRLVGALSNEDVIAYLENLRMDKKLEQLSGHVIVVGGGLIAKTVALRVRDETPQAVVLITADDDLAYEASNLQYLVIHSSEESMDNALIKARADKAQTLLIMPTDINHTLALTMRAHGLNPTLSIVVSSETSAKKDLLLQAGAAKVIVSNELIAGSMINSVPHPSGGNAHEAPVKH